MMGAETEQVSIHSHCTRPSSGRLSEGRVQGASDDILFSEDLEAPSPFDTGLQVQSTARQHFWFEMCSQDLTLDEEVPSLLEPSAPKVPPPRCLVALDPKLLLLLPARGA